jgi:hypothetical protein
MLVIPSFTAHEVELDIGLPIAPCIDELLTAEVLKNRGRVILQELLFLMARVVVPSAAVG